MADTPNGPAGGADAFTESANPQDRAAAQGVSPYLGIGDTGLRRYGNTVAEEFQRDLRGTLANAVYRRMAANDPICGAVLRAFSTLIRQVKWKVKPAADTAIAQAHAQFLRECLFEDMETTWSNFMTEVSTFFTFGFAPMEIIYKIRRGPFNPDPRYRSRFDDGRVGLRGVRLRSQWTITEWDFTDSGDLKGFWQAKPLGGRVYIPMDRVMLVRTEAVSNNPEGTSLLRNAYRSWFFKERIEMIEAIGAERDLAGIPVLRMPGKYMSPNASPEDKVIFEAYKKMVTEICRDENEGLVLPSDRDENGNLFVELSLLGTGGTRQFDTSKIVDRYNLSIATSVLADFILLGQKTVGSFALSDNKTDMFKTSLGAYLDEIEEQVERSLVYRLWDINGLPWRTMPDVEHEDVDTPTLKDLGEYLKNVTAAGALGDIDKELVNALRESANLPPQVADINLPPVHPVNEPKPEPAAPPAKKKSAA